MQGPKADTETRTTRADGEPKLASARARERRRKRVLQQQRDWAHFTSAAEPFTFNWVNTLTTGESVDCSIEVTLVEALADQCLLAGPADQIARQRDQLWSTALLIIAEAFGRDRPEGFEPVQDRALELAEQVSAAYGMRHAVDDLGDAYLCRGHRPIAFLGHVGMPDGGIVWSAGAWPDSIEEFDEPVSLSQCLERAAFLDGLHRRATNGREPELDAEHIGLLRAAEWMRLAEHGVDRRLLPHQGLALLCFEGAPRIVIGRVAAAHGRPSLADMTVRERARWIDELTSLLPDSLGELHPLPVDFDTAVDISQLHRREELAQ